MRVIIPIVISFFTVMILLVSQFLKAQQNDLLLVFCNVGQGDGIYLKAKGQDIVIDGGPDSKIVDCLNRYMPLYDKNIELMVVTHADSDHYGGFLDVFESYSVEKFATSPGDSSVGEYLELIGKVEELNISVKRLTQGQKIKIDEDVIIDVLWPPAGFSELDSDRNNSSLLLKVDFLNFEAVLTGDLDKEYLNLLIDDLKNIEVFKLSHHGSKTGTSDSTFQNFRPELSIISAGKNNRYGHPHSEVIDVIESYGLKYISTVEGDVVIESDGKSMKLRN